MKDRTLHRNGLLAAIWLFAKGHRECLGNAMTSPVERIFRPQDDVHAGELV